MEIKSIETKHITEQPLKGLVETDGSFVSYYSTTIRYTDPREGERAERVYSVHGQGATADESERDAMDTLQRGQSRKATDAYNKYQASQGNYFVDC